MVSAMQNRTFIGALAMTAVTFLVTGCGGATDSSAPEIATLRSADAPAASAPATQERPLIRPDASAEEIDALHQAHFRCLEAEGAPVAKSADGRYDKPTDPAALNDKSWGPAFKACSAKEPESWLAREQRDNPEYVDRLRDAVKCLKDKGFKARVDNEPPSIVYANNAEFMRADEAEGECQEQAFSARIKQLYQGE
jgi:hypothetical protein